jgi:hypothetical protein
MHGYAILDYARIRPGIDGGEGKDWVSYKVEPEWSEQHYLSGPHSVSSFAHPFPVLVCTLLLIEFADTRQWMRYTHYWDPIGPWKCQFLCKADKECASFFAWYGTYRQIFTMRTDSGNGRFADTRLGVLQ